jgi:CRP-like cAMP-binding protein
MVVSDLRPRIHYPKDVIWRSGEKAEEMCIVSKGRIILVDEEFDSHLLFTFLPGDYFGVIAILLNGNRLYTVQVRVVCVHEWSAVAVR